MVAFPSAGSRVRTLTHREVTNLSMPKWLVRKRCGAPRSLEGARPILAEGVPVKSGRMADVSYEGIITVEPGKRGGQPCIRGMRITVYDVLSYLASGMTEEQVLADFPYLTREDILACLSYAAEREHRMLVANE